MKLGDTEVTLPVAVGDVVAGFGNIGNAFLSQFVVTFDWSTKSLYLDPIAADGSVGTAAPYAGGIGWDGKNLVINKVVKGSPAEQAGMKLGDVVSIVDGKKVATRHDFCAVITGPHPVTIETADGKTYDIGIDEDFFKKP
jgi:membrane-associated protease RseP (regulator of RpoE activity)